MNIAIIEFNPFHDECLYSQAAMIKTEPAHKVFLVYNHNLENRITYWDYFEEYLPVSSNQWGVGHLRILNFLNRNNVEVVIFNSLHYKQVSTLLSFASTKKRRFFGIVHDLKDLQEKQTSQIAKKISGYFLLNDYLLNRLEKFSFDTSKFSAFYPIHFADIAEKAISKNENEIWITIPGLVQQSRRDYNTLLNSFKTGSLGTNIKLIFLGSSTYHKGQKSATRIAFEEADMNNQCLFWDGFVDIEEFHSYLKKSDYLLPLIHPGETGERYLDKITGLYNLGFAYQKRFVMEQFFSTIDDFKDTSIFYSKDEDLVTILNNLKPIVDNEIVYKNLKFGLQAQARKFIDFLEK